MTPDRFETARAIAVVADCHIHPGAGIDWPAAALAALAGADLIVTVGDMGEAAGLAALAAIAPVVGVKGDDDEDDPRTAPVARVIEAGGLRIGAVFDPTHSGLATTKAPLVAVDDGGAARERLFGGPVQVVLYASTHDAEIHPFEGTLWVNPGSITLPNRKEAGEPGTFAWLTLEGGQAKARIVRL
jgi:putative phosphoesterase